MLFAMSQKCIKFALHAYNETIYSRASDGCEKCNDAARLSVIVFYNEYLQRFVLFIIIVAIRPYTGKMVTKHAADLALH